MVNIRVNAVRIRTTGPASSVLECVVEATKLMFNKMNEYGAVCYIGVGEFILSSSERRYKYNPTYNPWSIVD